MEKNNQLHLMSLTKHHNFDFYQNGKDLLKSYKNKGIE